MEQARKMERQDSSDGEDMGGNKDLLSEEEKRINHIASEKKRRNNIRVAFETMTDLVPALNGTNFSKATILNKANEYIFFLKDRNALLAHEVQRLTELLSATRQEPTKQLPRSQQPSPTNSRRSSQSQPLPASAAPISKLPKDYAPRYRFQQSDEMKILMVSAFLFLF